MFLKALITMTVSASLLARGAHPETFELVAIESIVSPPDERGDIGYSTADMPLYGGWYPIDYDAGLLEDLFGPPTQVAPDLRGWAFSLVDARDVGVVLALRRRGRALPYIWDWGGNLAPGRRVTVGKRSVRLASAWLNALTHFEREVAPALGDAD